MDNDIVSSLAKAAPPVSVSGLTLIGIGLADWVLIITAIYTVLQLYVLIRDKFLAKRSKKKE